MPLLLYCVIQEESLKPRKTISDCTGQNNTRSSMVK